MKLKKKKSIQRVVRGKKEHFVGPYKRKISKKRPVVREVNKPGYWRPNRPRGKKIVKRKVYKKIVYPTYKETGELVPGMPRQYTDIPVRAIKKKYRSFS